MNDKDEINYYHLQKSEQQALLSSETLFWRGRRHISWHLS